MHAVRAGITATAGFAWGLSEEFGINPQTAAQWRKRQTVEDQKTGPKGAAINDPFRDGRSDDRSISTPYFTAAG